LTTNSNEPERSQRETYNIVNPSSEKGKIKKQRKTRKFSRRLSKKRLTDFVALSVIMFHVRNIKELRY